MKHNKLDKIDHSGFNIPKDYFSNLEAQILSHTKLKDSVRASGFHVPTGYIDTLEDVILSKVFTKKSIKVIPLIHKKALLYISSIAAGVLLLFNLSLFNKKTTFDNLSLDTVEHYILNEDLETIELAALFNDVEFEEQHFIDIDFTEKSVENYIDEHTDLDDLFIE